jgi:hypothetical protein
MEDLEEPEAGKEVKKVRSRRCRKRDPGEKCFFDKCRFSINVAFPIIDCLEICIVRKYEISVNAFSCE